MVDDIPSDDEKKEEAEWFEDFIKDYTEPTETLKANFKQTKGWLDSLVLSMCSDV